MAKFKTYGKYLAAFLLGALAQSQFPIWSQFVDFVTVTIPSFISSIG